MEMMTGIAGDKNYIETCHDLREIPTQHEEDAADDPGPQVDCHIGVRIREDELGVVLHKPSHLLNTLRGHDEWSKKFYNKKVLMALMV